LEETMNLYRSFLVLVPLVLAACPGDDDDKIDGPIEDPTFDDVQPILTTSCAVGGCHDGTSFPDMTDPAYDNIVDVASVELPTMNVITPGDTDNSYLYHKINGTQGDAGGSGNRMPLGLPELTADEITTIGNWIDDGAPQ